MSPLPTVLDPHQQHLVDQIRAAAQTRTAAREAERASAAILNAAVLAALATKASGAQIAAASGKGGGKGLDQHTPYTLANRRGPKAVAAAYKAAGQPDQDTALTAVADAWPVWSTSRDRLNVATETVASEMAVAVANGVPAKAVADASGMATATAYAFLAAINLRQELRQILAAAGLLDRYDRREGYRVDDVEVHRRGREVTVELGYPREAGIRAGERRGLSFETAVAADRERVAAAAARALSAAGLAVDEDRLASGEPCKVDRAG